MKIVGRLGTYECNWERCGFSYAEVFIYAEVEKKMFGLFKRKKRVLVWRTKGPHNYYDAVVFEKGLPDKLRSIFSNGVAEYERHKEAWDKENATIEGKVVEMKNQKDDDDHHHHHHHGGGGSVGLNTTATIAAIGIIMGK